MFRLRTFGGISLEQDGQPLTGRHTQRRRLALLAILAAARGRPVSRDKLLAYLWPDSDSERGRHTLSQTVYALRHDLGTDALSGGPDELRLDLTAVTSDVSDFLDARDSGDLDRAVALYNGPFLDGFFVSDAPEFERWVEEERAALVGACASALEQLADAAVQRADFARAVAYRRRRAALDPLSSQAALALMRALVDAGDRAGAISHARVHAALLNEQLGVAPDRAVAELAERVQREAAAAPPIAAPEKPAIRAVAPASEPPAPPRRSTPKRLPLPEVRQHVRWMRRSLSLPRRPVAGAIVVALVVFGATLVFARRAPPTAPDTPIVRRVVLGTIQSSDSTLSLAVREALRAELGAAPEIRVVDEARMSEVLELMRLPPTTAVTAPVAVAIAQRRGVPLAIVGSATPLGSGAQLVVHLLDARADSALVTLAERATTADNVIPAIGQLAATLRRRVSGIAVLVDSLHPLPAVTTSSLAALRDYVRARQALARLDRPAAIESGEAALEHDSLFALAHYLVGDLLWYIDRQRHAEQHLTAAYRLSARLPPRERLIVRARYEQVVRDRPDSALAYWRELTASYPDEAQAYEGLVWLYIALGRPAEQAAAAESALRLDPAALPHIRNRIVGLLGIGDTAGALAVARSAQDPRLRQTLEGLVHTRLMSSRGDWLGLLRWADSAAAPLDRHLALLGLGRLADAEREMERSIRLTSTHAQFPARAMAWQARTELAHHRAPAHARTLARRALALIAAADLSAPALARNVEKIVDVAARAGDLTTIAAARRLVLDRDAGRDLRSHRLALQTIDACAAYARREMRLAVSLLAQTVQESFYGRPTSGLLLLEADALTALGERARADSLYHAVASAPTPGEDTDSWPLFRAIAVHSLTAREGLRVRGR